MQLHDFQWLLDPLDQHRFLQKYWEQRPLHISRLSKNYFNDFFNLEDIDELFTRVCDTAPNSIDLLRSSEQLRYRGSAEGLTPAQLWHQFDLGISLRIFECNRFNRKIQDLCTELEQLFACPVTVNLYCSGSHTKALAKHHDGHCVFVAQVFGSKKWTVYGPPAELPLEFPPKLRFRRTSEGETDSYNIPAPDAHEVLMQAELLTGDLLYVPRGFAHEARTTGNFSVHLTVGVKVFTILELLTEGLINKARTDKNLRHSLPGNFSTTSISRSGLIRDLDDVLDSLRSGFDLESALEGVQGSFRSARDRAVCSLYEQRKDNVEFDLDSLVQRRGGVCSIRPASKPGRIDLVFGETVVQGPETLSSAFVFLMRPSPFKIAELPGLSNKNKLALVKRLFEAGILSRVIG